MTLLTSSVMRGAARPRRARPFRARPCAHVESNRQGWPGRRSFMFQKSLARVSMTAGLMLSATLAFAQMPNSYGAPINLETAKKVAAAAVAEVKKNNWTMAVAIGDTAGGAGCFCVIGWRHGR